MTREPVDLPMIDTALLHLIFSGALDDLTASQVRVINDRLRRLDALEAAARAVVDAVWSPSTNVYLAGSLICRICMSPDGRHSQSCPVSALATLLEAEG